MNTQAPDQSRRGRFEGALQIARYNWPQYAAGAVVVIAAGVWLWLGHLQPGWVRTGICTAALLAAWWSIASLVASHWVYDVSELYRWTWIPSALPAEPRRWLHLHAGLDESSTSLRQLFPASDGRVCDFFDATEMSEPSIQRARAGQTGQPTERISPKLFPFPDQTFDTVFLFFAAHEVRRPASREIFFREIHRVLAPGGTVLLVEHARDLANFAAFGPGFFHFLPAGEWRRLAKFAGLEIMTEQRRTPFVKVFQLRRTP